MGKRLGKRALLEEIARERAALDEALARLGPREKTRPGVTRGGWSVKDVLAHLVAWQQLAVGWYEAGLRGEKPAIPAPGYTLRDLPRFNLMLYRRHRRRSLRAVEADYAAWHRRVVALIASLPDADLVTLRRWPWTGPSWTLSDYLRASTAAHYLWARKRIRRWWRSQGRGAATAAARG
ncbi:MAG TPA: ClbS/DfsB family four-helix bundle protein [Gemmatimonadales bacterium]|nr:ClbS/DfsB family four-helix bundle protein [Gemmatimonadales bacterium]